MQQRGPPISPICPSDLAVILCESANGSFAKGVDFEMMEINIPELIPAHAYNRTEATYRVVEISLNWISLCTF